MYGGFFFALREIGVPVSLKEYLSLLDALRQGVCAFRVEAFYYLSRAALVKDERHLDRFDRVFARYFEGLEDIDDPLDQIPEEWLKALGERFLTEEEKRQIEALGGWQELMDTLRKRLAEQQERHAGGSRWIGTGGTSPFGAWGYNPEGVRIGQDESRHRRAVKVWDRREFKDYDGDVELGTRHMKVALRKLRRLAREGDSDELDLPGTIDATARNAGWLDIAHHPSRVNSMRLLLLLDVGGSMDDHVRLVERLFSAARSEFKHLETYSFHNCLYERVWRTTSGGRRDTVPTEELMRTYGGEYRLIFVGDASMSPYEILEPGGSVEHWNEVAGRVWMRRVLEHWERAAWINPVPFEYWDWTHSIGLMREVLGPDREGRERMLPLTLSGLEQAVELLKA